MLEGQHSCSTVKHRTTVRDEAKTNAIQNTAKHLLKVKSFEGLSANSYVSLKQMM